MKYQIKFAGKLDDSWSDWFDGARITSTFENDGLCITTMTVAVMDQPALFGILNRIRDMNLLPLSVERMDEEK